MITRKTVLGLKKHMEVCRKVRSFAVLNYKGFAEKPGGRSLYPSGTKATHFVQWVGSMMLMTDEAAALRYGQVW